MDAKEKDIIDEALELFRALVLFKNFKVKGPADKTVVFLTCFTQKVLQELKRHEKNQQKAHGIVDELIKLPVDLNSPEYFMNKLALFHKAKNPAEGQKMQKYLMALKVETWKRLQTILYDDKTGPLDCKYWMMMGKNPFMGRPYVDRMYT